MAEKTVPRTASQLWLRGSEVTVWEVIVMPGAGFLRHRCSGRRGHCPLRISENLAVVFRTGIDFTLLRLNVGKSVEEGWCL